MKKFLSILTVLFLVVLAANAQDKKWRVGIGVAYAPTTGGTLYTSGGAFSAPGAFGGGINGRYYLSERIAVGLTINSYSSSYSIGSGFSNGIFTTTPYLAAFEYHFGEAKLHAYGTVLAGFSSQAASGGFASQTGSGIAFAPGLGARLGLGERWDLDLNIKYLYQTSSFKDAGGSSLNGWSLPIEFGVGFKF